MELKNIRYDVEGTNEEISRITYEFDFGDDLSRAADKTKRAVISKMESIAENQYDDGFTREEFYHVTDSTAEKVISYKNDKSVPLEDLFKTSMNLGLDKNFGTRESKYLNVEHRGNFKKVTDAYKSIVNLPVKVSEEAETKLKNLDAFVRIYINK